MSVRLFMCLSVPFIIYYTPAVRNLVFCHKTDNVRNAKDVLNLKGHQNCMTGSKVTAFFLKNSWFSDHTFFKAVFLPFTETLTTRNITKNIPYIKVIKAEWSQSFKCLLRRGLKYPGKVDLVFWVFANKPTLHSGGPHFRGRQ